MYSLISGYFTLSLYLSGIVRAYLISIAILRRTGKTDEQYITAINEEVYPALILSSHKGYKLDTDACNMYDVFIGYENVIENPKIRNIYIIQRLISSKAGYDILDLSNELYVSHAAIKSDLKSVRRIFSGIFQELVNILSNSSYVKNLLTIRRLSPISADPCSNIYCFASGSYLKPNLYE